MRYHFATVLALTLALALPSFAQEQEEETFGVGLEKNNTVKFEVTGPAQVQGLCVYLELQSENNIELVALEKVIQGYEIQGASGVEGTREFGKPEEQPGKAPPPVHEHGGAGLGLTEKVAIDRSKISFSGECDLVLSGTGAEDIDALVEKLKDVEGIEATASTEKNAIHIRVTKGGAEFGREMPRDEFGKEPGKTEDPFGKQPGKSEYGHEHGKAVGAKDQKMVELSTILDAIGAKANKDDMASGMPGEKELGEEEKAGGLATGDLYLENIIWGARRID